VTAKVPFGAVRPLGEACLRLVRRAAAAAETRRAAGVVFVVALVLWWLEALVIPLGPGRDLGTYLGAYIQLFQAHPIDLGFVLGRTPISSLVVGGLLQFARGRLAEPAVSLLYAGSILAWFLAARRFGGKAALLTVVALLLYPGYGILFHELSSDAVFAAAFAGWSLLVIRILLSPTARGFALAGAGVGVLVLIRPGNQVLLVLALVPLLVCVTWRARLVSAATFLVPAVVLIAGWAVHNGIRYDNYTIARGGNATVPFYRAFVTDRIVRPSNGPASRELTRAVERDLLPKEPYRSYGITLSDFFHDASPRMQVDLLALSDRLKGWHSNYRWLRDIGVEAVRTHPARYTRGVIGSTWGMLTLGLYRNGVSNASRGAATTARSGSEGRPTIVSGGKTLPKPTEGEPIPSAHEGGVSTPDNSIYTVWTSPTEHHLVFVHPGARARYDALHRRMDELAANLPHRSGSPSLALRLNQSSRWFVPPALWLAIGIVLLAFRRPRNALALSVPSVAALLVIVLTALGLPAEPHYSVSVAPAFVLLAGAALLAPSRAASRLAVWQLRAPALRLSGIALGAIAGLWAARHYVSELHDFVATSYAPHDLAVFLGAASKVLQGASPYAFNADQTYAYPPILAFLVSPLHPLDPGIAGLLWTVISMGAIVGALWLLDVRDWRCFALTAAFLFTRSAVDLGTVGPLLLLAVAVAWHWRERLVEPSVAIGTGIALKLFLWPLVLWPAFMRRTRTSVWSVGLALVLVLVPWALIGFHGLPGYARLLHRLSDEEATSSYSVIALAARAHLPETAGVVLSVVIGVALLAAAAWIGRDDRRALRDRDVAVLTLVLAAGLAVSPIVWVHYFLLLLVPLALTRPRLSPLWFAPFAYSWVGEAGWPAGNATWLGIALVATLVILGGSLLQALHVPAADAVPGAATARLRPRSPRSSGSADRAKA
jgi:Glycosyltransferase family 87/Dolichyl-phosphate-mannose-protein mannosyltransferase